MKNTKFQLGLLGLTLFLIIGGLVTAEVTMNFDNNGLALVFSMRNPILTKIMVGITYMGNWQTVVFLCLVLLAIKRTRQNWGIPLSLAAAGSTLLYKGMKTIYERPRPELTNRLIEQGGFSFPSGHAMTGLVFYGFLVYLLLNFEHEKSAQRTLIVLLMVLLMVLIVMIGLSRLYLGLHYPTDVLAGWCLGMTILIGAISLNESHFKKQDLQ